MDSITRAEKSERTREPIKESGRSNPVRKYRNACANLINVPRAQSYGGVLFSAAGLVLLREPIDHLGGYVWTWPKGRSEKGETPAETALREVYEETGYRASIIDVLPKEYLGTSGTSAFYLMEPVGEQEPIINETIQTRWVSYKEAYRLIEFTKHAIGRHRDRTILDEALHWRLTNTEKMPISVGNKAFTLSRPITAARSNVEETLRYSRQM